MEANQRFKVSSSLFWGNLLKDLLPAGSGGGVTKDAKVHVLNSTGN